MCQISNICCCFLQAGALEKIKINILYSKLDTSKMMSYQGHLGNIFIPSAVLETKTNIARSPLSCCHLPAGIIKLIIIIFRLSTAKNARISSCSRIGTNIKAWGFITVMHTSDLNYCSKLVHSFAQNIIPGHCRIVRWVNACS